MKYLLIAVLFASLLGSGGEQLTSATVRPVIVIDPNGETNIIGCVVYAAELGGTNQIRADIGGVYRQPLIPILGDSLGTNQWRFWVTVYNSYGIESPKSDPFDWDPRQPGAPKVRIEYDINIQVNGVN